MVLASLAFVLLHLSPAKIDISVKDTKDGDVISAERNFRVTVDSTNPVTQVEFYVGDSLRDSDASTPYEFKVDPLNEPEGAFKVAFVAYTSEGEKARKELTLKIETGVSKGAEKLVEEGNAFLVDQKWDDAIRSGRVALKAKAGYNPARILMARAYMGKGVMDKAQQFAEDALAADPNFTDGREMLAAINLRKALSMYSLSGTSSSDTLKKIGDALQAAVTYRRKNLDAQADALPANSATTQLHNADVFIRAMRYDAAIKALQADFNRDPKKSELGNRIAYAQVRLSRLADANQTLRDMEKVQSLDAYGYALYSVVLAMTGDDTASDKMMTEAVGSDPDDLGARTAQVAVALKRGRNNTFGNLVNNLAKDESQRTEVNYYLAILLHSQRSFADADDRFTKAVLAEPCNSDMYIERGTQALYPVASGRITSKDDIKLQFDAADMYYRAALTAAPDSAEALTSYAMMKALQGKASEAVSFAEGATKAGDTYAAAHYTASMVFYSMSAEIANRAAAVRRDGKAATDSAIRDQLQDLDKKTSEYQQRAVAEKDRAAQLDPKVLGGRSIPKYIDALEYFVRHGRVPLLTAPK